MPRNATAHVRLARLRYRCHIAQYPCRRLQFVDESGLNLVLTRTYGRGLRGRHVYDAIPKYDGRNVTILSALSWYGLDAVMTIEGATDAEVFRAYANRVLVPTLRPGDVVVMDNLAAHKVVGIETAIAHTGARLVYLPPYSPDGSPIKPCWLALKTRLRGLKARTREALDRALTRIVTTVSNHDTRGWFARCGYSVH